MEKKLVKEAVKIHKKFNFNEIKEVKSYCKEMIDWSMRPGGEFIKEGEKKKKMAAVQLIQYLQLIDAMNGEEKFIKKLLPKKYMGEFSSLNSPPANINLGNSKKKIKSLITTTLQKNNNKSIITKCFQLNIISNIPYLLESIKKNNNCNNNEIIKKSNGIQLRNFNKGDNGGHFELHAIPCMFCFI